MSEVRNQKQVLFPLGQTCATPGALEALERVNRTPLDYLALHARGNWGGALCDEDRRANEDAVKSGDRLLSSYFLPDETKLWIITEAADEMGARAATTLLLPEEY